MAIVCCSIDWPARRRVALFFEETKFMVLFSVVSIAEETPIHGVSQVVEAKWDSKTLAVVRCRYAGSIGRQGHIAQTSKGLSRVRAAPLDALSHRATDIGGGVKSKSLAERCLKQGRWCGPALRSQRSIECKFGKKECGEGSRRDNCGRYRGVLTCATAWPTRASHDVYQALWRSEDAALFHLECEILELSLALDAQHCRVARL